MRKHVFSRRTRLFRLPRRCFFTLLLASALLFAMSATTFAATPGIYIDGKQLVTSPIAFINENNRTYVPLRAVCNALGFTCEWNASEQSAKIYNKDRTVLVYANSNRMIINDQAYYADAAPISRQNRISVPLRTLCAAVGAQIDYLPATNCISIDSCGASLAFSTAFATNSPTGNETDVLCGYTIILDAGHGLLQPGGWSDPGAVGKNGLYERDVVLNVANDAAKQLREAGATVITTRNSDSTTLTLSQRAAFAKTYTADVFVSVHANANTSRKINGSSVYHNKTSDNYNEDARLAKLIQKYQVAEMNTRDAGVYTGNFGVLRNICCPGVIAEIAFISNETEEKLLATAEFQHKAAIAIAKGIREFLLTK